MSASKTTLRCRAFRAARAVFRAIDSVLNVDAGTVAACSFGWFIISFFACLLGWEHWTAIFAPVALIATITLIVLLCKALSMAYNGVRDWVFARCRDCEGGT